jgi:transposase
VSRKTNTASDTVEFYDKKTEETINLLADALYSGDHTSDERKRLTIVLESLEGASIKKVAAITGACPRTIKKCNDRHASGGLSELLENWDVAAKTTSRMPWGELSAEEIAVRVDELEQAQKTPGITPREFTRLAVVIAALNGGTSTGITKTLAVSFPTVAENTQKYATGGVAALLPRHNQVVDEATLERREQITRALLANGLSKGQTKQLAFLNDVENNGMTYRQAATLQGVAPATAAVWLRTSRASGLEAVLGGKVLNNRVAQFVARHAAGDIAAFRSDLDALLAAEAADSPIARFLQQDKSITEAGAGAAGCAFIVAWLELQGYRAQVAAEGFHYDVFFDDEYDETYRIQVKAAREPLRTKDGTEPSYRFKTCKAFGKRYSAKTVDIFAFVALDKLHVAFAPYDEEMTKTLTFRQPDAPYARHANDGREFVDYPFQKAIDEVRIRRDSKRNARALVRGRGDELSYTDAVRELKRLQRIVDANHEA